MRRLPFLLATLFLGAHAPAQEEGGETVKNAKSGLVVNVPEQWTREEAREKGSVKFAGIYDLTPSRYVLFSVETGPATDFDEAQWLAKEKEDATKILKTTDIAWTTEPILVGGTRTVRFTVGGTTNGEKEYPLRIRRCGLVKNGWFFRITELSYNKAHEESADALTAMWEAIKFEDANPFAEDEPKDDGGEEEKAAEGEEGGGGGAETPKGEPIVVEDAAGNFKVSVPAGWSLERAPPAEEEPELRLVIQRKSDNGDVLASMEVFRIRWDDSTAFTNDEPGDFVIKKLGEASKFFETYYEQESAKIIRPEIDARANLGRAEKSCGYELRALRLSEEAKIEEAKKLIARGDTSVTVPEFLPLVVRGRLAMISPYIYVTRTGFARQLADNEQLVAEYNQIHDSWEFASTEGKPPPLSAGDKPFGNTLADPANATERKKSKVHEYKKGAKAVAAIKFDYILPQGFQEAERVQDEAAGGAFGGADVPLQVVAQDGNNGWVWIRVVAVSQKSLGSLEKFEDKQKTFETWVSNFESLARGTGRLPKKPQDIKVGNLNGDGCEMQGKINNFRASELNLVTIEGGWWIRFEMKTRGSGATTFAKQIDAFKKKFRATKK